MLLTPLLQSGTPDTLGYMLLGYFFLGVLPALYVISFFIRKRNLERDLDTIETLSKDEKQQPAARATAMTTPPPSEQRAEKPSQS